MVNPDLSIQNNRGIKSYVIRGRITKNQKKSLQDNFEEFGIKLDCDATLLTNPNIWFKNQNNKLALEIGFGMGENILHNALNNQHINWVGIETHNAGVGKVFNASKKMNLTNLKIYHGDVLGFLTKLENQTIDWIQIFFPDPWPKKKHHKRRLITQEFITLIHQKMNKGGKLEIATDWQNYATGIESVFLNEKIQKLFINQSSNQRSEFRVFTNFENKAHKAGRLVFDFCLIRK